MSIATSSLPRPGLVNMAISLAMAVSLAGVVVLFFFLPNMMAHMQAQGLPTEAISGGVMYGAALAGVLFVGILCFFIARGNNVVRWVWAVFSVYGFISALGGMGMTFGISPLFGVIGIALQLLSIISVVLLFMPVSTAWFKAVKQAKLAS